MLTCRSASAVTVVDADAVLFAGVGSLAVGPTFAVSVIVPACGWACAVTVRVAVPLGFSTGPLQEVVLPQEELTSVPPVTENDVTGVTGSGPTFEIVTLY